MNRNNFFSIVAIFSISSMALAAGTHGSGTDDSDNQTKMKNMDHSKMQNMDHSKIKNMDHWAAPKDESARENPVKMSSESILAGAELYQSNCASCHGKSSEGDGIASASLSPKPANLRAMAGTHPDGDFAYKIKTGRGAMPGWGNTLSDTEVWHLVNYIQLLDKEAVAAKSEETGHKHAVGEGHDS